MTRRSTWQGRLVSAARPRLRQLRYRAAALGRRQPPSGIDGIPLPPPGLRMLNGPDDFVAMGRNIAHDLVVRAGLDERDHVLDIGCGAGRAALGLTEVLGPDGRYEGFDVVPEAVAWCSRHITPVHPNFGFRLADVRNDHYHRRGRHAAEEYRFPYPDAMFDVVVATSVFTHLQSAATERYLREAARVLRPRGRLVASFFLVDDQARRALDQRTADLALTQAPDGSFVVDHHDPEAAVGHAEDRVRNILTSAAMELRDEPRRGNWSGRDTPRRQDLVVATKSSEDADTTGP